MKKGMGISMCETGLKLAPIFSSGMILQRESINHIYGTEASADTVTALFMDREYRAAVAENHEFDIELPPVAAGGPYTITVIGSSKITISDILFGDVYILSGQSNMELPIRRVLDVSEEEISHTCEPFIRQYLIPAAFNFKEPEKYIYANTWKRAEGKELLEFGAAGFFFAKKVMEAYQVPVGLIMTAVGGCRIEAWMSPDTLQSFGDYEKEYEAFKDIDYFNTFIDAQREEAGSWSSRLAAEEIRLSEDENYKNWDICTVPSLVSDYGKGSFCGSVYLCREVYLEAEPDDGKKYIYMGTIIDSDDIRINGQLIGHTDYRYPPRKYPIPEGVLKKGNNLITVRIVINNGNGGTVKGRPYYLYCGGQSVSLQGEWFYRIGKKMEEPMPAVLYPPNLPVCFYNTVKVPLSRIPVKGILWYQGESNTHHPDNYSDLFAAMVFEWRKLYGWEVPFIYVQLANYREPLNTVEDTGWAKIRDQQRLNLSLPGVAMAVTLDIGEGSDLHPQNKKEVGLRIFKAAGHLIYHENEEYSGPIPEHAKVSGSEVYVYFKHLEESQAECRLNHFELAGPDHIYYKAAANRRGSCVTISCKEVEVPVSIRYAWLDNPENINFYNDYGLPAGSFCIACGQPDHPVPAR